MQAGSLTDCRFFTPFAIEIASFGNAAAPVSCGAVMGCPATGRRAPALRRRCSVRGGRSRLCAELQRYAAHIRARLRAAFRRVARAPFGALLRARRRFAAPLACCLRSARCAAAPPCRGAAPPVLRRLPRPLPAGGAARCGGLAPPVPPPAPRLAAPAVLRSGCVPRRRCAAPSPWVGSLRSPSRRVVAGCSSAAGARVGVPVVARRCAVPRPCGRLRRPCRRSSRPGAGARLRRALCGAPRRGVLGFGSCALRRACHGCCGTL